MKMVIRKKLVYIKNALIGCFQNTFEKIPKVSPGIAKITISHSAAGLPLYSYKIGSGPIRILYLFGIHGNEVGTVKLAYYWLDWLSKNVNRINTYSIFVIPCLNPDGYKVAKRYPDYLSGGRIGRFNGRNVDLNRNFDVPSFKTKSFWPHGEKYMERTEVSCGEFGGSEPEIKALTDLIMLESIRTAFVFHNVGRDVMGNKNRESQRLVKLFSDISKYRFVNQSEWESFDLTGTMKEWCEVHNIAYIEVEGSRRWGSDWVNQREAIIATLQAVR